jgi:hypothetical protein
MARPTVLTRSRWCRGVAHGDDGRGLGLAVGDDQFADVHLVEHALHQLDRAGRAAHHAGAQAGEVEAGEIGQRKLGHVHGGNAVDRGGALVVDGLERGRGSKVQLGRMMAAPELTAVMVPMTHP